MTLLDRITRTEKRLKIARAVLVIIVIIWIIAVTSLVYMTSIPSYGFLIEGRGIK